MAQPVELGTFGVRPVLSGDLDGYQGDGVIFDHEYFQAIGKFFKKVIGREPYSQQPVWKELVCVRKTQLNWIGCCLHRRKELLLPRAEKMIHIHLMRANILMMKKQHYAQKSKGIFLENY